MSDQDDAQQKLLSDPLYQKILQKEYWQQQGQPWRTEPEIDAERQQYLAARRYKVFEEGKRIFSLKDISLSRADIEWLLATLEDGQGPVFWDKPGQRGREGVDLEGVNLQGLDLSELPLAKANFRSAHLEGANLVGAHFERAILIDAHLEGADLSSSFLDTETDLNRVSLYSKESGGAILADIRWGDVNVAVVDWSTLLILGDEAGAKYYKDDDKRREQIFVLEFLGRATRAYRQLAVVLRNQGLNDDANRFTYHAQLMQKIVYKRQKKYSRYLGSLFLALLSGYGYKPIRSFLAYLIVILTFATTYFILGRAVGPVLSPLGSVVLSMTSFHGRGFFPGGITLDDPLTVLAALEAFVGLLIEVTFIATLTRRLFGG